VRERSFFKEHMRAEACIQKEAREIECSPAQCAKHSVESKQGIIVHKYETAVLLASGDHHFAEWEAVENRRKKKEKRTGKNRGKTF